MTQRTLGLDVSFWQDYNGTPQQINFNKAYANGARFVIIRTSQNLTADPDLEYNAREAKKAGLLTSHYHFLDYRHSASAQGKFFSELVKEYDSPLPGFLDVERHRDWVLPPKTNMIKAIKLFKDAYEASLGKPLGFYTNPSMNKYYFTYASIPEWMLEMDFWIAHYVDPDLYEPSVAPWDKYTFWQFTDREDGLAFGMESKQVDANYFNGSLDELKEYSRKYTGEDEPEIPEDPDKCDCKQLLLKISEMKKAIADAISTLSKHS